LKIMPLITLLSTVAILTACVPGAPLSDPFCLNCYYDVRTDKYYTADEWAKLHPSKARSG